VDVSDGLLADLGHILYLSGVGGVVDADRLPLSQAFLSAAPVGVRAYRERDSHLADVVTPSQAIALTGGDDYELCFTAPAHCAAPIAEIARRTNVPIIMIGEITTEPGLKLRTQDGVLKSVIPCGYEHF
jgi:thiamine-monophosphate kinase